MDSDLDYGLDKPIESAPDLHTLKKRFCYVTAYKQYFIAVKVKRVIFVKPVIHAKFSEDVFLTVIKYVQHRCFGAAVELSKSDSPDALESILKKLSVCQ